MAPLLTSKRRSTVEPGTCEDSLWPAMQHSCTARDSSRPYSSPSHRCIRGLMPHHSCFSCASSGRGPGSGRGYQPRSSRRPPGSGRGRGTFSVQNSGFFGQSRRGLKHASRRGLKYVPTSDQGDRDFYTHLTHAVYTNHHADNSDVWVPVTTKGVKSQVDFSPGGFSHQRCLHAAHACS